MTQFVEKVVRAVRKVPKGKVVSYGQIAAYCGSPRAARQVGWVLRNLGADTPLPWWRVINSQGRISIKGNWQYNAENQKHLLVKEGVEVSDDLTLDIEQYRFSLK